MNTVIEMLGMLSNSFLYTFGNFIFWLVVLLVVFQYKKTVGMEVKMFGVPKNSILRQTLVSAGFGILGGILASVMLIIVGISLDQVGIIYLWPLAILFMFINPRYICFAYAGGIIGLLSMVSKGLSPILPNNIFLEGLININVPGLMALIGILHLTESLLIALSGHIGVSPLFIKNNSGQVVGGFSLQKFWPLPIVGLITILVPEAVQQLPQGLEMPTWWPLLGSSQILEEGVKAAFMMLPIAAGLGYGDISISSFPREKTLRSAKNLSGYSLLLLGLAILAYYRVELMFLAVIFAPLGHEYLIIKGNREEFSKEPIFVPPEKGIKILDTLPGYPGHKAGLSSGDVIMRINDCIMEDRSDLNRCIQSEEKHFTLWVEKVNGKKVKYRINLESSPKKLGIILVPDSQTSTYVELKQRSLLDSLKERLPRKK
ncbi:site-2 protease family protein [Candidatus Contubernalis alkaliaceticus]|uniref:site-2 protease family protein n=1 Tax=Candidatus Contubernalis alkaliaceticus TaxID=338645 RepID=UPI001F4C39AA|nr:site-2 protease family protein [Candidatus Contubernalis alkalaceticus]UNC90778.1 PDZ domain-containing protein [Candidatus Contubernalis alkalaceticus]